MNPAEAKVMIAMPVHSMMHPRTTACLLNTYIWANKHNVRLDLSMRAGCGIVQKARNLALYDFMQSECNRIFWIDSDMIWTPEQFQMMLSLSLKMDAVGATYPAKLDPPTFFVKFHGPRVENLYHNEYGCLDVGGFGLGFTVMSRKMVEDVLSTKAWVYDQIANLFLRDAFRVDTVPCETLGGPEIPGCPEELYGKPLPAFRGEDMAFFDDCIQCGYKVWLYPDMDLGHSGEKVYRGDLMAVLGLDKLMEGRKQ